MLRLILLIVFFLLSLLTVFRAPANGLWYVSILVTEFSWIFFSIVILVLLWTFAGSEYIVVSALIGFTSLVLFTIPVVDAYRIAPTLKVMFYSNADPSLSTSATTPPFSFFQMITGTNAKEVAYTTLTYDTAKKLTLDFYAATTKDRNPCIIVVHGGSWAGGDSQQLPELNSVLAKHGYAVASINYRLAPQYKYPVPLEDIRAAILYLQTHAADLSIDTDNFVLLGRSAGGQIVLSAAYTLKNPAVRGVISFYGPADMVWGYANPTNPLVLNSRKVMEDYLGGTYQQVPQQYIKSSAVEVAAPQAVPTLLIHGGNDPLVSHLHGVRLGKKLDSLGVQHYEIYLPWATHAFDWTLNGPGGQLSTWSVVHFLKIVTRG